MNRRDKLFQARENTKVLGVIFRNTFTTPDGKKVLDYLKAQYLPEKLSTDDPHTTAIRVGQSDPIRDIIRRVEDGMA